MFQVQVRRADDEKELQQQIRLAEELRANPEFRAAVNRVSKLWADGTKISLIDPRQYNTSRADYRRQIPDYVALRLLGRSMEEIARATDCKEKYLLMIEQDAYFESLLADVLLIG